MLLLILLQRTFVHLTLLDAAGEFVWCFTKQGWIVLELGLRQLESGIKAMKLTLRNVWYVCKVSCLTASGAKQWGDKMKIWHTPSEGPDNLLCAKTFTNATSSIMGGSGGSWGDRVWLRLLVNKTFSGKNLALNRGELAQRRFCVQNPCFAPLRSNFGSMYSLVTRNHCGIHGLHYIAFLLRKSVQLMSQWYASDYVWNVSCVCFAVI